MTLEQLIELQQLKDEIRGLDYYIDITLYVGDEVLVQIGQPESTVSYFKYGENELSTMKSVWNMITEEDK